MRAASAVELVAGVATPVVLAAGIATAVFGTAGRSVTVTSTTGSHTSGTQDSVSATSTVSRRTVSLYESGVPPTAATLLALALLCALLVAAGSVAHARHRRPTGLALLGGAAAVLRAVVVLFGFSLSLALLPGWLCALVALLSGLVATVAARPGAAPQDIPTSSHRSAAGRRAAGIALGALVGLAVEWTALSALPVLGAAGLASYAFFGAALASPLCALAGAALSWKPR